MFSNESDKLERGMMSNLKLAGVDNSGELMIGCKFELRKEEGRGDGEKKRTPVELLYIFSNSLYQRRSILSIINLKCCHPTKDFGHLVPDTCFGTQTLNNHTECEDAQQHYCITNP